MLAKNVDASMEIEVMLQYIDYYLHSRKNYINLAEIKNKKDDYNCIFIIMRY